MMMKNKFKKQIEDELIHMFIYKLCMEIPNNIDEITKFVEMDVKETADEQNWTSEDVSIAFRRWVEAQTKKKTF